VAIDTEREARVWIRSQLVVSAALALVDPLLPQRVYDDPSDGGDDFPYISMTFEGGEALYGNGPYLIWDTMTFFVRGIVPDGDTVKLDPVVGAIRTALHGKAGTTSIARITECVCLGPWKYVEDQEGATFIHRGGRYQLRVQEL
jgi:hypothetical protein